MEENKKYRVILSPIFQKKNVIKPNTRKKLKLLSPFLIVIIIDFFKEKNRRKKKFCVHSLSADCQILS